MGLNRRLALSILLSISSHLLSAQHDESSRYSGHFRPDFDEWQRPISQSLQGKWMTLNGGLWLNSSHLNQNTQRALYMSQSLAKEQVQNSLISKNSTQVSGLEMAGDLNFFNVDSTGRGFYIMAGYRFLQGVRYSNDAFNLFMAGNAQFEGKLATLNPLQGSAWQYFTLGGGIIRQKQRHLGLSTLKVGLNLIGGINFSAFNADELNLYTAQYGEYLSSDANFTIHRSGREQGVNGYGISTNLYYSAPIAPATFISIQVNELGAVGWNANSIKYNADSSYRFEGVNVDGILTNQGRTGSEVADSIIALYLPDSTVGSIVNMLPGFIQVQGLHKLRPHVHLFGGLHYRWNMARRPRLHGGITYLPKPNWQWTSTISIGGMGNWDIHQQFLFKISRSAQMGISIYSLEGIILPESFTGSGAAFTLAVGF